MVHKGKRWLAYRIEMKRWFLFTQICLVELDDQWLPIKGTDRILPLHTRFDNWGAEDPRIFVFQDKLHISYGDGFRMLLAELTDDGHVVRSEYIPANERVPNPPQDFSREKNWGFFSIGDRLFAQQYGAPQWILEFDPEKWTVINRWTHDWVWRSFHGPELHGGSHPVLHDGKFYRFCHAHKPIPRSPWRGWDGVVIKNPMGARYSVYLMTFEAEPPFAPIEISKEPVLWTDFDGLEIDSPTAHAVVFMGSAERVKDGWQVVYGENDLRIVAQTIPDSALTDMVPIMHRSPVTRSASDVKGAIHFIWVQGVETLPPVDEERIESWRKMNPDWRVLVWDRELLTTLLDGYPQYRDTWNDLCKALDTFPSDRSIVAKVSDFARLLLLYHTHIEGQLWNVYADTDTNPLRPLSDFLEDRHIYGSGIAKEADPNFNPHQKGFNWDDVDFVVSQENRLDKRPAAVTNAVLIARPRTALVRELIQKGVIKRWQPTLQAWGPEMLLRNVIPRKNAKPGHRAVILPYHYLVYNPKQHKGKPAPTWAVCEHYNDFRWRVAGVKASQSGKLSGSSNQLQIV